MKKKLLALVIAVIAIFALSISASAETLNGWVENADGTYSYYKDGTMWRECPVEDPATGRYRFVDKNGIMVENAWYFFDQGYYGAYWLYHGEDGLSLEKGWQVVDGRYYYFPTDYGYAATDTALFDGEGYWAFDKSGNYYAINDTPGWSFAGGRWHYLKEDGDFAIDEVLSIDGTEYIFDRYANLASEGLHAARYRPTYHVFYANADGTLFKNGWKWVEEPSIEVKGWFFFDENGFSVNGWKEIDGKLYVFDEYYGMYSNRKGYDDAYSNYIIGKDGVVTLCTADGWHFVDGSWYYIKDGDFAEATIIEDNGNFYYFDYNGTLFSNGEFYYGSERYWSKADGTLRRNEWYFYNSDWYYFNDNCRRAENGFYMIDGTLYYFRSYRPMTDQRYASSDKEYVIMADGACVEANNQGWLFNGNGWFYVDDDKVVHNTIYEIDGVYYAFESDGRLFNDTDEPFYDYHLIKPDGTVAIDKGWYAINGRYYYVKDDNGTFAYDEILEIDGQLYAFNWDGYIYTARLTVEHEGGDSLGLYAIKPDGTAVKITADGWYLTDYGYVLIKDGSIHHGWELYGGYWYYFDYDGYMLADTSKYIDDVFYYFDTNGHMVNDGWFIDSYGDWYFADENGAVLTHTIYDGYYFDDYGYTCGNTVIEYDGAYYATNAEGKIIKELEDGWNFIYGSWYYLDDDYYDYFCHDTTKKIDGDYYYFDEDGRMLTNYLYSDYYYFGADGKRVSEQWIYHLGNWHYADEWGYLYSSGIREIDDVDYLFNQGVLQCNKTMLVDDIVGVVLATSDANGVVVSKSPVNSDWSYEVFNGGVGTLTYTPNGKLFTGWYGNYYIQSSRVMAGMPVPDGETGNTYFLGENGLCLYNSWASIYDYWFYAKPDGTLCHNEWYYINGAWYYFTNNYIMHSEAGIHYVDGAYHCFNEDGTWAYQVGARQDGWSFENGNWYYFIAGAPVTEKMMYIDGDWYFIDESGIMRHDTFVYEEYDNLAYYFTSNGTRAKYAGWHFLNNHWVFFNDDNSVTIGTLTVDGKVYYQDAISDVEHIDYYDYDLCYATELGIFTGNVHTYRGVYQFDASGAYTSTLTSTGWVFTTNDGWLYLIEGKVVEGSINIGGDYYFFAYDEMIHGCCYGNRLYGDDGRMITTNGWHFVNGEWYYVVDGYCATGLHLIDGVEYFFDYNFNLFFY